VAATALWLRRPRVDARTIARHLDRSSPALEDSAELLVVDESGLSPVQRLQRERTRRALDQLVAPALPHRAWRWGLGYSGAAAVAALVLALWPGTGQPRARVGGDAPQSSSRPLRVGEVEITVSPPAYTRLPPRRGRHWDVEAPAGSRVTWRVGLSPGAAGAVVTAEGDSLSLPGSLEAERSLLYFVTLRDSSGRSSSSDFHQLTVFPDAAPTVTVLAPEPRTSVAPGAPAAVALKVLVGDDYGVAETRIVATLTTGQGEGVKFRERILDFERTLPRPAASARDRRPGALLERTLDARALGLGPGDELYFYVRARDNRAPRANETRSETFFITLLDTASALVADFSGMGVSLVPEYFRSQRQIIIDTERLLADRPRLDDAQFRARSENIGLDQHALRLRYGEIVGDEVVEGDADPAERHEHDIEDNATRLAPQVKATLQASLAQMWEAELRLRTHDPRGALPFEHRALALLKEVQQAARVYVRRVGLEPPPLEPDRKRLTGDVSAVGRPRVTRDVESRDSLPAVRAALAIVRRHLAGAAPVAGDVAALERAGRELAPLAIQDPGRHLATVRGLRALLDALARGAACPSCPSLEAGLLRALPAPVPAAAAAPEASGVARTYFDLLRSP
jgi:hypothetical protein